MYAEVAVNVPVHGTFHYQIPHELADMTQIGQLVQVGFRTAQQHGIIVDLLTKIDVRQPKLISSLLDQRPVVTPAQVEIARWMSNYYRMPLGTCLWLFLPPGLAGRRDIQVTLLNVDADGLEDVEAQIVALLQRRGPLLGNQLNQALPGKEWRAAVDALIRLGVVSQQSVLATPRARPKMIRTATLAIHPDQIPQVARHLGRNSKQADVLEVVAAAGEDGLPVERVLRYAETTKSTLKKVADSGLIHLEDNQVSLTIPPETVAEQLIALRKGETQQRVLKVLARENGAMDVSWLYAQAGAKANDLKRLEDEGLVLLGETASWRDSLAQRDFVPALAPPLTPEQQAVWDVIAEQIKAWDWVKDNRLPSSPASRGGDNSASASPSEFGERTIASQQSPPPDVETRRHSTFLIHGVTGSGKTEIYLRAIELILAQGRQALFLVPEIALTAQTVRRVAARFPGKVGVVHSGLSEGERYDTWRRAREGLLSIVVGARSALFTPFPDLGLIVMDEEHDSSYKQGADTQQPYYHVRAVAEQMMRANKGILLLGSATPAIETYFRAQQSDIRLLELPNRIMGHRTRILEQSEREGITGRYYPARADEALTIDLPTVEVVDMRDELKAGNADMFSRSLKAALRMVLDQGEQALLFLNRRGTNTYVFCRDCGYVEACPYCDLPMTYHRYDERLRCHLCGFEKVSPFQCPDCQSRRIKYFGVGTQEVEQVLQRHFPLVRVLRWDADTARKPGAHEEILQRFLDHKADIVVGTQMIAKGLDLPRVTLVGMVSADVGLNLPDFRAGERTFQLLTQVAGRAGRGLLGGRAILQTYQPQHYVIAAAAAQDYQRFFTQEIAYRRELGYPPLRRLARLVFQFSSANKAQAEAERAAQWLQQRIHMQGLTSTEIIGPAPCFFGRINDIHRWHLLVRSPDPMLALEGLEISRGWLLDIDPVGVL